MRPIKFRAWDKEDKIMLDIMHWTVNMLNAYYGSHYIIMQYTGLKDKNGKEIYEGDIVDGINIDGQEHPSGEVVFNAGCFSIKTKHCQHVYEPCLYEAWEEMLFIIGNIYENPELLEGK